VGLKLHHGGEVVVGAVKDSIALHGSSCVPALAAFGVKAGLSGLLFQQHRLSLLCAAPVFSLRVN
jgi:hypothetical protein